MKVNELSSLDKTRMVVDWANYHVEFFNDKIRSFQDWEKLWNYKTEKGLDYLDDPSYWGEDEEKYTREINLLLGYKVY